MHGGSSQTPLCKGGVWEASSVTAPQCWSSLTAQREEARKTFSCSLSELKEGLFQSPPPPSPPPTTLLTNQLCLPSITLFSSFHHALKWAAAFFWPLAPLRSHYFIELILEMTTEEFHFNAMSSLLAFYCFSSATEQTPPPSTDFRGALWILKTLPLFKFSLESTDVIKFNLNCSDYVTSVFI